MEKEKSVMKLILSKLLGLLIFAILIGIINFLTTSIPNQIYISAVAFINSNLVLLVIMIVIFSISEILFELKFPISLPAPVLSAVGSIFLITFLFKIIIFTDVTLGTNASVLISPYKELTYILIFIIVLISGYFSIFHDYGKKQRGEEEEKNEKEKKVKKSWEDVGNEFRLAIFDLLHAIRSLFDKKKTNKKH